MGDYRDTLVLPFEKGLLPAWGQDQKVLFLNAEALPRLEEIAGDGLVAEQPLRTKFLSLRTNGIDVSPHVDGSKFDGALILASRFRQTNEMAVWRAWQSVRQGGVVVYCGDNKSGVKSLRKWVAGHVPVADSLSKNHAVAFWAVKTEAQIPAPEFTVASGSYVRKPGIFSADGPDAGSQLLIQHFDNRIAGRVADFGAGWGYLAAELLQHSDRVQQLELFEADWHALECARQNVVASDMVAEFHWCDLTTEPPRGPFDWIIMNPPFHTERAAEPALGQAFIEAAAKALPAGGRLLMVANRNLPYEQVLQRRFRRFESLADEAGFKVLLAVR